MKPKFYFFTILIIIHLGCKKNASTGQFEGIFFKGSEACPNKISITNSPDKNLPINTTINVSGEIQAEDGQSISFIILKYSPDTLNHNALCTYGKYDAIIKLSN